MNYMNVIYVWMKPILIIINVIPVFLNYVMYVIIIILNIILKTAHIAVIKTLSYIKLNILLLIVII